MLLDFHPSDTVKFELNVNGWTDSSDSQAPQALLVFPRSTLSTIPLGLANYPLAPHDDRAADWTPGSYKRSDNFYQASLRGDIEVGGLGTLTSISAFSNMGVSEPGDGDATSFANDDFVIRGRLATASEELRLAGRVTDRLSYIVGTSYAWYKSDESAYQDISQAASVGTFHFLGLGDFVSNANYTNSQYHTESVFGSVDYKLSDSLMGHAGVRYSATQAHGHGDACTINTDGVFGAGIADILNFDRVASGLDPLPPIAQGQCVNSDATLTPGVAHARLDEHNVPFRVGLDWKPSSDMLLYANVSRGFKGGSFPNITATASDQFKPRNRSN